MAKAPSQKKPARARSASGKPSSARPGPKPSGVRRAGAPRPTLSFSRVNAIWLGAAVLTIAAGYLLLAQGSTTIAPILLVVGYLVLLPIGIIKK